MITTAMQVVQSTTARSTEAVTASPAPVANAAGAPNVCHSAPNNRLAASEPNPSTALYQPNAVPWTAHGDEIRDQRLLAAFDQREVHAVDRGTTPAAEPRSW